MCAIPKGKSSFKLQTTIFQIASCLNFRAVSFSDDSSNTYTLHTSIPWVTDILPAICFSFQVDTGQQIASLEGHSARLLRCPSVGRPMKIPKKALQKALSLWGLKWGA